MLPHNPLTFPVGLMRERPLATPTLAVIPSGGEADGSAEQGMQVTTESVQADVETPAATLGWWAETLRNRCLVLAPPPAGTPLPPSVGHPLDLSISYEPRSLATSPDGRHVAVGTKAGEVSVVTWTEASRQWTPSRFHSPEIQERAHAPGSVRAYGATPAGQSRQAVRTLCFLGNDLLLAGGGGHRLLRYRGGAWTEAATLLANQVKAYADFVDVGGTSEPVAQRWFRSIRRGMALVPDDWKPTENHAAVYLGVTPAGWFRVFSVAEVSGTLQLSARWIPPTGLWAPPVRGTDVGGVDVTTEGDESQKRDAPVAVSWRGASALFLTATGRIRAWTPTDSERRFPLHAPVVARFEANHPGSRYRAMSASSHRLAVLCDDLVAVVDRPDAGADGVATIRPRWARLPGARDIAAFHPASTGQAPVDRARPMWVLVATDRRGLAWSPWVCPKGQQGYWTMREPPIYSTAGTGQTDLLRVAVGGTPPGQAGPSWFLATTGRDHRLRVSSFLDRTTVVASTLTALAAVPRPAPDAPEEPAGVVRLRVLLSMCSAFDAPLEAVFGRGASAGLASAGLRTEEDARLATDQLPPWRVALGAADVRELTRLLTRHILPRALERLPQPRPGNEPPKVGLEAPGSEERRVLDASRLWSLRLVRRATELRSSARDLGPWVADRLADAIEREAARGRASGQLLQLAEILRKWVSTGHTFAEKSDRLIDLCWWNWTCGRNIDALAYAARLLRQKVDRQWLTTLPRPQPNPAILAMCVAKDGAFSVHAHHDGRVTACDAAARALALESTVALTGVRTTGGWIEAADNEAFQREHRHGRYTRALGLTTVGKRHLLLLGWKGDDAPGGDASRAARVDAFLVEAPRDGSLRISGFATVDLVIRGGGTQQEQHEVYSILHLGTRKQQTAWVLGTRGPPRPVGDQAPAAPSRPLVEVRVAVAKDNALSMTLHPGPTAPEAAAQQRSTGFHDAVRYNPAWCLASVASGTRLWSGHHDGSILPWAWSWDTGLATLTDPDPAQADASISALAVAEAPEGGGGPPRLRDHLGCGRLAGARVANPRSGRLDVTGEPPQPRGRPVAGPPLGAPGRVPGPRPAGGLGPPPRLLRGRPGPGPSEAAAPAVRGDRRRRRRHL